MFWIWKILMMGWWWLPWLAPLWHFRATTSVWIISPYSQHPITYTTKMALYIPYCNIQNHQYHSLKSQCLTSSWRETLNTRVTTLISLPSLLSHLWFKYCCRPTAVALFVPTNNVFIVLNVMWMEYGQERMIPWSISWFNTIVDGICVRSCWWMIPTGTKLSDKNLRLKLFAG